MASRGGEFLSPLAISFDGEEEREPERLPVGFKFRPTDEELILRYLRPKVLGGELPCEAVIVDVNVYNYNPTRLTEIYADKEQEKSWYFFTSRNRKYEKGSRPDRAASGGYWKATAADTDIQEMEGGRRMKIGGKKPLVFMEIENCRTRKGDQGTPTEWMMHEFKIEESKQPIKNGRMLLDDYVLSKIYRSRGKGKSKKPAPAANPNNLQQQQIQPSDKRARREPEPEPKASSEPTEIQPEQINPNPQTLQNQLIPCMLQDLPSGPGLLNPNQNQIYDQFGHPFPSADEDFLPTLPSIPEFFDQFEPTNHAPNFALPQQCYEIGNFSINIGGCNQNFQQQQQQRINYGEMPAHNSAITSIHPAGLSGNHNFNAGNFAHSQQYFNTLQFANARHSSWIRTGRGRMGNSQGNLDQNKF
ncbi:uncharacterized protein A4U43_C04F1480 [Asparagus officinalis]|uniref:NAC domain-containing protein n=1 Tax=Asparagus officinalis TaxID=4686 RepID=A0A5P1EXY0_ASPOF|nr:NAC domain-containing protein 45-like [Asparagus officinalis]ONK70782.1 uncharacterized protein A4U43_C04F1480 [Asparagus officinalis]